VRRRARARIRGHFLEIPGREARERQEKVGNKPWRKKVGAANAGGDREEDQVEEETSGSAGGSERTANKRAGPMASTHCRREGSEYALAREMNSLEMAAQTVRVGSAERGLSKSWRRRNQSRPEKRPQRHGHELKRWPAGGVLLGNGNKDLDNRVIQGFDALRKVRRSLPSAGASHQREMISRNELFMILSLGIIFCVVDVSNKAFNPS
jgi:hypothetical protein